MSIANTHTRLQTALDSFAQKKADVSDVLQEVFADPSNKQLIAEKAVKTVEQMKLVVSKRSYLERIKHFVQSFFHKPSPHDPKTLQVLAEWTIKKLDSPRRDETTLNIYDFLLGLSNSSEFTKQHTSALESVSSALKKIKADALPLDLGDKYNHDEILGTFFSFPLDQRADVVDQSAQLFTHTPQEHLKELLLKAVFGIAASKRAATLRAIASLIENDPHYSYDTLKAIGAISAEDRTDVVLRAAYVLQGSNRSDKNWSARPSLIEILAHHPHDQRKELIEKLEPFWQFVPIEGREVLLQLFSQYPPEKRNRVLAEASSWLATITSEDEGKKVTTLSRNMLSRSQEELDELLHNATPLLERITSAEGKRWLLEEIFSLHLPHTARIDVLVYATSLLHGPLLQDRDISALVRKISQIPQDAQKEIIDVAIPLVRNAPSVPAVTDLLDCVLQLPREERRDVGEKAAPLFNSGLLNGLWLQKLFLKTVVQTPKDQRAGFVTSTTVLLQTADRDDDRWIVLQRVCAFEPAVARVEVITHAAALSQGLRLSDDALSSLLDTIFRIPQPLRADLISQTIPLVQGLTSYRTIDDLLRAVSTLAQAESTNVIGHVLTILQALPNVNSVMRANLLGWLASMTRGERQEMVDQISTLLRGHSPATDATTTEFLAIFHLIPRSEIARVTAEAMTFFQANTSLLARIGFLVMSFNDLQSDTYYFRIKRADLENNPILLLSDLSTFFKKRTRSKLKIRFEDEAGVDDGGVGRQFVSMLFQALKEKMHFRECENGLFRPDLLRGPDGTIQPLYGQIFYNLGQLMMFCLNASEDYPIGLIFDASVFEAITRFKEHHVVEGRLSFQEMFTLYSAMHNKESDKQFIESMERCLQPLTEATEEDVLRDAYMAVEAENAIAVLNIDGDIEKIKQHYAAIQSALRSHLSNDKFLPVLGPLICIAQGMRAAPFSAKLSWAGVQALPPQELSQRLQGVVTREMILAQLEISPDIAEQKQTWIKNWIQQAPDHRIKEFLSAMTGSPALGWKKLKIEKSVEKNLLYTCRHRLALPFDAIASEEQFAFELEHTITGNDFTIN